MKFWVKCCKSPAVLKITIGSLSGVLLGLIPMRLAIAQWQAPPPQMAVMLGGGSDREKFTAKFAQRHPHLTLWISTGTSEAPGIFQAAKVPPERVVFDQRATDTVTNFTTVVSDLQQRSVRHVYVITSDFHLPRATAIATVVFGSQGIAFTPISVPSERDSEPVYKTVRDVGRALLWLFTGRTGASLNGRQVLRS